MRVAVLCETFSKKMGYLQRMLPKYLAHLGVETHVVTMDLFPYYRTRDFGVTYGGFADTEYLVPGTVEQHEGYTLHVLPHRASLGHMRMVGLRKKLEEIKPDVVQTMANFGWIAMDAAWLQPSLGYKLFTGNHFHASVFPLAQNGSSWGLQRIRCLLTRTIPGWMVGRFTEKCYAIAPDCADVAVRFFGAPEEKVVVCPLGVDSEFFHARNGDDCGRKTVRKELGFCDSDIVCIYTGRFSEDKNPLLMARAIAKLAESGEPYRGLFVGNGVQAAQIRAMPACKVREFVPVHELGKYFHAADIGVWPTQESMSIFDAAACGLPVVVNHTMGAMERVDGNGITYRLNELDDLIRALRELRDERTRARLGAAGALKMADHFTWESIARRRLRDYETSLGIVPTTQPATGECFATSRDKPRQEASRC